MQKWTWSRLSKQWAKIGQESSINSALGPITVVGWLNQVNLSEDAIALLFANNSCEQIVRVRKTTPQIKQALFAHIGQFVELMALGIKFNNDIFNIDNLVEVNVLEVGDLKGNARVNVHRNHAQKILEQQKFIKFKDQVKDFFVNAGCVEIQTPNLVVNPGMELNIEPFKLTQRVNGKEFDCYLPTSPELSLKKHLCKGLTDVFEIKTCYRNNEESAIHQAEFTMLEVYHNTMSIKAFCAEIRDFIHAMQAHLLKQNVQTIKLVTECAATIKDLFFTHLGFDLSPNASIDDLHTCCKQNEVYYHAEDTWSDLFDRLMIEKIEPHFVKTDLLFVTDYPKQVAALAKISDSGFSGRFEIYIRGVEVANGFDELTDAVEQNIRMHDEYDLRVKKYNFSPAIDTEFINELKNGMPQTVGIAIGLDRLFMVLNGKSDIKNLTFCLR